MFFKRYEYGENAVVYAEVPVEGHEGKTTVGLAVFPKEMQFCVEDLRLDSLVQVAFSGDDTLVDYTLGLTMRNRVSTLLSVVEQTQNEEGVSTRLTDGAGNEYLHELRYFARSGVFSSRVTYSNKTGHEQTLESLQSISLSGILSPSRIQPCTCGLTLHRMTSAWSRECRLKSEDFPHLGLDMSWARYGVKTEKWGQVGSFSNRNYHPFCAIEDEGGTIWAVSLQAPFSWQMEVYQEKETCSLTCGLSDYEFGQWRKRIPAGESFTTDEAFLCVKASGGVNAVCNAFNREADARLCVPSSEEEMPVLFNEYCTTWGCPSEENIDGILKEIQSLPIAYFVIDAGWYKPDGKSWVNATGDWKESKTLFPCGIARVVDKIHAAGMQAGIWFEFEVAGRDSEIFYKEDDLLKRDGKVITAKNRRFLNIKKKEIRSYLDERFLSFLQQNQFTYLKIDYNDTYGFGCDGEDSLAENGRAIARESLAYLDALKERIPNLVIENCSSGGSRIEPYRMSKVSMCSFSDAHECEEIPLVAANVSRVVPARQSQIWAVIRKGESDARTIYSLTAAMIGRICLSGDFIGIPKEKLNLIRHGLDFYNKIKRIVRYGEIRLIDNNVNSYREPNGRQVYVKEFESQLLVIVHFLKCQEDVFLPLDGWKLKGSFTDLSYGMEKDVFHVSAKEDSGGAFLFEK